MWPKPVLEHNADASETGLLLREYVHIYLPTCSKPLGMFSIGQFFFSCNRSLKRNTLCFMGQI